MVWSRWRGLFLTCLLSSAGVVLISPVEANPLIPDRVGATITGGWEARPIRSSTGEVDPDLGTGDGRYWFAPTEDVEGRWQIWSRWRVGDSKLRFGYERRDWVDGEIFGREVWSTDLRQKLGRKMEFKIDVEYSPRIYLRHRSDKDALPGSPRFRPETYRGLEMGASLSKDLGRLTVSALGALDVRDENRWFNERDRVGRGGGVELDYQLDRGSRIRPFYLRMITESKNEPDLGSDRSHREHEWGLRAIHSLGALTVSGYGKLSFRSYTTTDPEDTSRFGRKDMIRYFSGRVAWKGNAMWTPFFSIEVSGRSVNKATVEIDEVADDGVSDRSLIRFGVDIDHALAR